MIAVLLQSKAARGCRRTTTMMAVSIRLLAPPCKVRHTINNDNNHSRAGSRCLGFLTPLAMSNIDGACYAALFLARAPPDFLPLPPRHFIYAKLQTRHVRSWCFCPSSSYSFQPLLRPMPSFCPWMIGVTCYCWPVA